MVKDVILSAMRMLRLNDEAEELAALDEGKTCESGNAFLRLYNLVVCEIAEEYRRKDYVTPPQATSLWEEEAAFTGISARVLAYGVAAEYCVTEGLDEAELWDGRYKSALSLAVRPRVRIKERRMY